MTENTAIYLLSDDGRKLAETIEAEVGQGAVDMAALVTRLRNRKVPEAVASAIAELILARKRAAAKFGEPAGNMYFTREALEQASSAAASAYHASLFLEAGVSEVLDLCSGIGADAIAMARAGMNVTMIEVDPARALFARENARVVGLAGSITVLCSDATIAWKDFAGRSGIAVWFDPARRVDGRRTSDPEQCVPPLSLMGDLAAAGIEAIGVKLSPAVDHSVLEGRPGKLEFLSDQGECKEALLLMGRMSRPSAASVSATVLADGYAHSLADVPPNLAPEREVNEGGFLYEPDPAVIRAHLVHVIAEALGATAVDPKIAYLIGPRLYTSPFAKAYSIITRFPYHLKSLRRALIECGAGRIVIKKRGFPLEPAEVLKQLKHTGDGPETIVVLTRVGLQHQAIVCRPSSTRSKTE